ncbi:MAG: type I restriction endonuclease subunit R [Chloroflexales bacterium]|nr:type I restriction endonuclease subunit R [Chloroflexales bacterium]
MPHLPSEYTQVERPLIEQLVTMGWQHLTGDTEVSDFTERASFREVLLVGRLQAAIRRLNLDADGQPWLDAGRVSQAVSALERLGTAKLLEANQRATELLTGGTIVDGDPVRHGGKGVTAQYIDFAHPERNDFLVINQFRVDLPGGQSYIIPDLVLFVNGIPLVVIECKSPAITNPIEEGITQLLRYTNQGTWADAEKGVERLFHYNLLMIVTSWFQARAGAVGGLYDYYLEWKDTSPVPATQVATELGVGSLSAQQTLVAGMLRPAHLLDLLRSFTLFQQSGGRTVKVVARYQQFRAVHRAVQRLQHGQTKAQHGAQDQRGGIIWHTQGSGKSLTMVFLVRKLRTLADLRRLKVVVVTDRTDLERQLSTTAALTGEKVRRARNTSQLKAILRQDGPDLVFAMIQKYQDRDEDADGATPQAPPAPADASPTAPSPAASDELFEELNDSSEILVLVDEAHRSQASTLHANLLQSLPNCARIGFTGTPILAADRKRTADIFGPFIDRYTIKQSEEDGATVPILYEGRTADAVVDDGRSLDQLFEDMFRERTPEELEAIKRKYATTGNVLEAPKLIAAKAANMLRHYVRSVLPDGLKAQVVASSRLAAVRYQAALAAARDDLVARIEALEPALLALDDEALERRDDETRFLVRAHAHLATIRRLEFAAIISSRGKNEGDLSAWTDPGKHETLIERFKRPLSSSDPKRQDSLAILCVKSMLLTGFDAPVEQALYLDRFMQGHELLQAIARVNRTYPGKKHGLVVDYFGVARHLPEALAAYSGDDVEGALADLADEVPQLDARHKRALALFHDHGIPDIADVNACVELLRDVPLRATFSVLLREFLKSLDIVLPRPAALPYVRDAKILGFINKSAANLYRDGQITVLPFRDAAIRTSTSPADDPLGPITQKSRLTSSSENGMY